MKYQTHAGDAPLSLSKPEGGYVQISTLTLGVLWWSRSEGLLSLRAVRVGLALFELRIRRDAETWRLKKRRAHPKFTPRYTPKELGDLCGLPEKRARAALKELLALGLLAEFAPERIRFASSLADVRFTDAQRSAFLGWFAPLTKRKRFPVPRRILALAVESSGPAFIAVVLGACLRCSWRKPEGFSYTGRLSCPWLSARFRLSLRAIQSAKEQLVTLGWLHRKADVSRFGELVEINPAWHRLASLPEGQGDDHRGQGAGGDGLQNPPPAGTNPAGMPEAAGTNPAGFSLTRESPPSGESKYQRESRADRPEAGRGPGVFISEFVGKTPRDVLRGEDRPSQVGSRSSGPEGSFKYQDRSAPALPPPRLSAIRPEDFRDLGRALELFRQAVKCGLMPNASEHARLLWLAAVERARTVPARNPAGVFLHLVKGRHWDYLSNGHYEAANARLKAHLFAPRGEVPPLVVPRRPVGPSSELRPVGEIEQPAAPPALSRDAQLLTVVRAELAKKGLRADAFTALRAHAGWDRARYEAAISELGNRHPSTAASVR
jgi:hypothetical protein